MYIWKQTHIIWLKSKPRRSNEIFHFLFPTKSSFESNCAESLFYSFHNCITWTDARTRSLFFHHHQQHPIIVVWQLNSMQKFRLCILSYNSKCIKLYPCECECSNNPYNRNISAPNDVFEMHELKFERTVCFTYIQIFSELLPFAPFCAAFCNLTHK